MPHDPLYTELLKRNPSLMGGAEAKIGPKPEPSTSASVLEMLTGLPADPSEEMGLSDVLLAGLPFAHKIKHLRRMAGGYGKVPLYHGTTADNATKILEEGFKLPESGEAAAMAMAKRYGIPWTEWKHRVEPGMVGAGYGEATRKLSMGPFGIAERWSQHFPQGEINSQLNEKARMYVEAKRRGVDLDALYDEAVAASKAQGLPPSSHYWPDAIGAPDLMKPTRPGGVVLQGTVDARNIPEHMRHEARYYLKDLPEMGKKNTISQWEGNYKDFKIDPRKVKDLRVVKGKVGK